MQGAATPNMVTRNGEARIVVRDRIRALKIPEARVAVFTTVGPNKRQPEPDPLDEASSSGSPYGPALTDWALADNLGKSEMHANRSSSFSV